MIPTCEICTGVEMELEKTFRKHRNKTDGRMSRVRRFKCPICDYRITIYADGEIDLKIIPSNAAEEAKENNELLS